MLIAGLGFPIPFWILHRMYPKVGFNLVFTPILVGWYPWKCLLCIVTHPLHSRARISECWNQLQCFHVIRSRPRFTVLATQVSCYLVPQVQFPVCISLLGYIVADCFIRMSAALDGGTSVMIFIYTFAVGGGSGKVIPFPTWALVRFMS
jgi:hypothetical protein